MKTLYTYVMRRKHDDKNLYDELALFLQHVQGFQLEVKNIQFYKSGDVEISALGELDAEQMEHVGIEPSSKVKR